MKRDPQLAVRIKVSGKGYVGHYEVGPFQHGGHTITVFYHGQKKTDRIPPEVNHASYTDSLAEGLLKELVIPQEPIQPSQPTPLPRRAELKRSAKKMDVSKTIVRLATELGLPPGKGSYDTQFGGWTADVLVEESVLHTWSDRGEFWAKIECDGKTIPIHLSEQLAMSSDLEAQFRKVLMVFRDFLLARKEPNQVPEPTSGLAPGRGSS